MPHCQLAEEGIGDEVFDTLEDVLGDRAQPAPPRRVHRSDDLLLRHMAARLNLASASFPGPRVAEAAGHGLPHQTA
ncbi:hypothetical protein ACIQRJ_13270 [Streptomyces niveus]|uniref:hypothetical protein n=1 Tax=Streptomyces niveus TaxID=193462 RepID=UPI003836751A